MPKFSEQSMKKLKTCDYSLQELFREVVKGFDCTIITGHRLEADQAELYRTGLSKLQYPDSKHNAIPSEAVDAAPYPINWNDTKRFYFFAGYVKGIAEAMGINIRWGGDWDSDTEVQDQTFNDLVHFELRR